MPEKLFGVIGKFYDEYMNSTSKKLKIIDAYLFYIMLTGIIQFVYCALVGTFPFNSFLSGFISCVGSFVIGVCLRLQCNPQNKMDFVGISPERAFADFIFANLTLHLVVMNFIGWLLCVSRIPVQMKMVMCYIYNCSRLFIFD